VERATVSVWVKLKTWPMWSEPDTVSGGVSTENTWSRGGAVEVVGASSAHRWAQAASMPSSVGLSGTMA
jgi:hypothetical protein